MPNSSESRVSRSQDLGLDRHVERGGRLVGDQQVGVPRERHRDHHALAHAAGELVRVVVEPGGRRAGCRPVEQLDRALARLGLRDVAVRAGIASAIWRRS